MFRVRPVGSCIPFGIGMYSQTMLAIASFSFWHAYSCRCCRNNAFWTTTAITTHHDRSIVMHFPIWPQIVWLYMKLLNCHWHQENLRHRAPNLAKRQRCPLTLWHCMFVLAQNWFKWSRRRACASFILLCWPYLWRVWPVSLLHQAIQYTSCRWGGIDTICQPTAHVHGE